MMKEEELAELQQRVVKQQQEGVIVLPAYCEAMVVNEGDEIISDLERRETQ